MKHPNFSPFTSTAPCEPRESGSVEEFKGKLYLAEPGDVIYSKIDVRNGAIGLVPADMSRCAVSSEYPVYQVRSDVALCRVHQTRFPHEPLPPGDQWDDQLARADANASSRSNSKPWTFPCRRWRRSAPSWPAGRRRRPKRTRQRNGLKQVEAELPRLILQRLGIPVRQNETPPKMLVCGWRDLERWSVSFISRASTGAHDVGHSRYSVHSLGDLALVFYGIQKSPENRPGSNARPYLRVANVQRGQLDLSEIKYIEVSDAEMEALRLQAG